jgi:hypothetical protein
MKQYLALAILSLATPVVAFVTSPIPLTITPSSTAQNEWKKSVQNKQKGEKSAPTTLPRILNEFGDPESEKMKELVKVMGLTRVKKAARKQKRVRNQMIREGLIELNEEGQWVKGSKKKK